MTLTLTERLIISQQLQILEKLYPDNQHSFYIQRKAIEDGYELHYSDLTEVFSEGLDSSDCAEVLEILSMYRGIIYSYKNLSNNSNVDAKHICFPGFDGNHETSRMAYVRYFINDLERFEEIKELNNGYYNSHTPMLDKYRKMLIIWNSYKSKYKMSIEEVEHLIHINHV